LFSAPLTVTRTKIFTTQAVQHACDLPDGKGQYTHS
jgi:hypothetical protein